VKYWYTWKILKDLFQQNEQSPLVLTEHKKKNSKHNWWDHNIRQLSPFDTLLHSYWIMHILKNRSSLFLYSPNLILWKSVGNKWFLGDSLSCIKCTSFLFVVCYLYGIMFLENLNNVNNIGFWMITSISFDTQHYSLM
jgi:hypothetical protein